MKISERWLREWVNPPVDSTALADKLNMAGHECEARPLLSQLPSKVVVGRIRSVSALSHTEHLRLCEVEIGANDTTQIVCGAPNATVGMKVAVALPGAELPGGISITPVEIHGQRSNGMLCSAAELGLAEQSSGILTLDAGAPLGTDIAKHLSLDDHILDLELTPNRGDCLSVAGLAREAAALYGIQQTPVHIRNAVVLQTTRTVCVDDRSGCPHYTGRAVRGLNTQARTPDWMRERLRRSGTRCLHPVVDITNYVMLELGQPLHAFDNDKLSGALRVRRAEAGETLHLLDNQTLALVPEDLVIADDSGALALAGVMGGITSSVTDETHNVFVESACFETTTVAKNGRRHKLLTEARHRFERGVDPALQRRALERATTLIIDICGGSADSIAEAGRAPMHGRDITLRRSRVTRLLGCEIPDRDVSSMLTRLGIEMQSASADTWRTRVPTYRYDLVQEVDLIEEVGRLYGYDRIEARPVPASLAPHIAHETTRELDNARATLVARGYHEIVSYSFVDSKLLSAFTQDQNPIALDNPIAATMDVMRTTLWCGLVSTWNYNRQRQRAQARLFEVGACFERIGNDIHETQRVAGLIAGAPVPRQWGQAARAPDFFDAKTDMEALLGPPSDSIRCVRATHPALHIGCSARVLHGDTPCGWIGQLHPAVCERLGLPTPPIVFELDWEAIRDRHLPHYTPLSTQPAVRRDLALEVDLDTPAQSLVEAVMAVGIDSLRSVEIFDVYSGSNINNGVKSIALSVVFQDNSDTLRDEMVDAAVARVVAHLNASLGATVRGEGGNPHGGTDES